jgi:hypothetical protein
MSALGQERILRRVRTIRFAPESGHWDYSCRRRLSAWTAIRSGHQSAVLPVTAATMPGTSALYGRDKAALPSRAQHHLTLAAARLTAFANGGKYSKG